VENSSNSHSPEHWTD